MTMNDVLALIITPVGGIAIGAAAYWLATRPEKSHRHPAE